MKKLKEIIAGIRLQLDKVIKEVKLRELLDKFIKEGKWKLLLDKYRYQTVAVITVLVIAILVLSSHRHNAKSEIMKAEAAASAGKESSEVYVQAFRAKSVPYTDSLHGLTGTVRGLSIELKTSQEEVLIKANYKPGDIIPRGAIIYELDHTRTKARLRQAEIDLDRKKSLFEVGGASKAELEGSEESYNLAKKDNDDTYIIAPKRGYLGEVLIQEGELVTRQSPIAYFVSADDPFFVETSIIEKNLISVLGGQKADVTIDAFPGEKIVGKVLSVSPEVLTTSRMVPVRIGLPSYLNRKLKPGLSATCDVTIFSKQVLLIPQTCLAEGKDSVYVIVSSNTVHKEEIKIGYRSRDYLEVTSGLTEGDIVVISPDYAGVQEGNKVRYSQPEEYKTEAK